MLVAMVMIVMVLVMVMVMVIDGWRLEVEAPFVAHDVMMTTKNHQPHGNHAGDDYDHSHHHS